MEPPTTSHQDSGIYEFRFEGILGEPLLAAIPEFIEVREYEETTLTCHLPDQAALSTLIDELSARSLEILDIRRVATRDREKQS